MAYIDYADEVVFSGKSYQRFPLILNNNHIINRLTLKYFLAHRILWGEKTFHTYTKHICDFFSQLEVENSDSSFDHIDNYWLEEYANQVLCRNKNTKNYVAQLLSSIIRFLIWCEDQKYCNSLIGITSKFKIRVIQTKNGFTNDLIIHYQKQKSMPKIAPRKNWIKAVLSEDYFESKDLEVRFSLMVEWASMCGLRAHEICALSIDQIPLRETIEKSIINKENIFIDFTVTKGMKKASIPVSGILLRKTLDYIESERQLIINKNVMENRIRQEIYIVPKQIFLSSRTGNALHPRTFSNQIRKRWLQAVKNGNLSDTQHVWLHGLRHRFATDKLKDFSKFSHIRNPHELTRTLTRHSHASSLDTYTSSIYLEDMYE